MGWRECRGNKSPVGGGAPTEHIFSQPSYGWGPRFAYSVSRVAFLPPLLPPPPPPPCRTRIAHPSRIFRPTPWPQRVNEWLRLHTVLGQESRTRRVFFSAPHLCPNVPCEWLQLHRVLGLESRTAHAFSAPHCGRSIPGADQNHTPVQHAPRLYISDDTGPKGERMGAIVTSKPTLSTTTESI